jgi:hypothetical protein
VAAETAVSKWNEGVIMNKPISVALSLSLAVAGSAVAMVGAAPAAQATTCMTAPYWTSTYYPNSSQFTVTSNSDCADVYAAGTKSYNDWIEAWYYRSSAGWVHGTAGYVWVTTPHGWRTLLTNVQHGTAVRGQGASYTQNVQYVW